MYKYVTNRILWRLARVLAPFLDSLAVARLQTGLAYCGEGVRIRIPIVIESPEMVSIMNGVSIGSFVHMWGGGGIVIGENTMIGAHVAITSATHDPDDDLMTRRVVEKSVRIGHDVWIGTHAVIFPGVTIGDYAIVAAGAVVREDVPPNAIFAGVPAKLVRWRKHISSASLGVGV